MHRLSRIVAFPLILSFFLACAPRPTPTPTAPAPTVVAPPATAGTAVAQPSSPTPAPSGQSVELLVFAAASLTDSFKEIGAKFEAANSGTKVTFSFGGSQVLSQQIVQGAAADVFASANGAQMDVVVKSGQVAPDAPRTFARNHLLVIVPTTNPARVATLADLAKPGLKIILEDKSVPAGQYSLDFLDKAIKDPAYGASYKDNVLKNVVSYEQDVKAVITKVSLGEGDAGIVYTTDVTPAVADKVSRIAIPDQLNTIATYPIAAIKDSKHPDLAQKFVDYVMAADGQAVLAKWGFIPPAGGAASGAGTGGVALTGLVNNAMQLTAADLQKQPSEMVSTTFKGPNGPILLAWEQDGQPLTADNEPLRLVVPGDAPGARYVTGVVRMEVRDPDSPARLK